MGAPVGLAAPDVIDEVPSGQAGAGLPRYTYGLAPYREPWWNGILRRLGVDDAGRPYTMNAAGQVFAPGSPNSVAYATGDEGGDVRTVTVGQAAEAQAQEQAAFDNWLETLARGTIITADAAARARELGVPVSMNEGGQWVISTPTSGPVLSPIEWRSYATETEAARQEAEAAGGGSTGEGERIGLSPEEGGAGGFTIPSWAKWAAAAWVFAKLVS